jgi:sulfoquinovose isomerase
VTTTGDSTAPHLARRWVQLPGHRRWLASQAQTLLDFFRATVEPGGRFVELDDDGAALPTGCPPATEPQQNLLTVARTVHCYALGELLGIPGCRPIVDRGLRSLWHEHRDTAAGGYVAAVGRDGQIDTTKAAYGHAFVLLAASSAIQAGHGTASRVFDDVLGVIDERFWDEDAGAARESFDGAWNELEAYRGANSNMHLCESFLAAADAAERPDLARRSARIARRLIDGNARAGGWLLTEHYDANWSPVREYNRDRPDDPFRPYGATVGHSLEWSRLLLATWLATGRRDGWYLEDAEALFERAVAVGWDSDHGGLAYTVDFDGAARNTDHYWWPVAEGIAAAAFLSEVTGRPSYEEWYRRMWDYAATVLIDHRRGGWYPQFDDGNRPKVHPWYGKPDLYHALQACLLPAAPLAPSVAAALRRGD